MKMPHQEIEQYLNRAIQQNRARKFPSLSGMSGLPANPGT